MKDYKKILEGVVNIINTTEKSDIGFANICTYIGENCPELKESRDERIRKSLLDYLHTLPNHFSHNGGLVTDWIAWLEKHGELAFHFHQLEEYIMQLEKQCEQKSLDEIAKEVTNIAKEVTKDKDAAVSFLKSTGIMNENGELADEYKIEQDNQKPDDETKLKIEEGKWYVCISQFCNCIEGRAYKATSDNRVMDDFGTEYDMHNDAYKYFRLWTIQDAKEGDVLAYENDIVIFKENNYNPEDKSGCMFIHCSCNDFYEIGGINPTDYKPATKEQRNLLFSKMKEAGYEWDTGKRELRKIEQNPAWSEEDEKMLNTVIHNLRYPGVNYYKKPIEEEAKWLKSLKDRYTWKPSDEQMECLKEAAFDNNVLAELYDNLKKLK